MSLLVSAFSSSTAGACLEPFQQTLNRVSSTHWTSHWAVQLSTLSWRGTVHASLQNVLNLKYICTGSTFISAAAAWSLCKITNNMRHECFPMQASLSFIVKHCVSSPPFSPSNVWVIQYSDVSTFAQIPAWGWVGTSPRKKLCSNFHFHSDTSSKDLWLGHRKYHIYNSLCLHDTILIVAGLEDKYISCCVSCWVSLDLPSGCSKRKERRNKVHPSPDSEGIMTTASPDWPNAFLV